LSQSALLRLMMFLSPSFPIGAFAYSSGLEQAVADGHVTGGASLEEWLGAQLESGSAWNDAVFLNAAHGSAGDCVNLRKIADVAKALSGSQERYLETMNLGGAFVDAVRASGLPCPILPDEAAYPVVVGAVASANAIGPEDVTAAFLHGYVSNQIQCAIRLGALGQNGGVALLAKLEPVIVAVAAKAAQSTPDDLGSNTIQAEIAAMRHETLTSRIFRT
jgi:urease accessory protein